MFKIIYSSTLLILDLVICLHQEVEINIKTKKKIQQIKNIVNNETTEKVPKYLRELTNLSVLF